MSGKDLQEEGEASGADPNASYLPLLPGRGTLNMPI